MEGQPMDMRDKIAEVLEISMDNVNDMDVTFGDFAAAGADAILEALPDIIAQPMTERKFTPPTTFPAEYRNGYGQKCVILVQDPSGRFIGYVDQGDEWRSRVWDATGWFGIDSTGPDLHDIPQVISTWQNVHKTFGTFLLHRSRPEADKDALPLSRIAVLRRDTIDGVTTAHLEDV